MPHPVDVHVGQRLRLRRTFTGMTQESLGNAIGVTFQQIQKYERGTNRMGSSRLYEFSKILSVPVSYFFEEYKEPASIQAGGNGMAEQPVPAFDHEQMSSRETMEMMRAYYKITSQQARKRVFELIKTLAEE